MKNNLFIVILLLIVTLASGCGNGNKIQENDNNDNIIENENNNNQLEDEDNDFENENEDSKETEFDKLLKKISVQSYEYYKKDKLLANEMSNEFKVTIAFDYADKYFSTDDEKNEYMSYDENYLATIRGEKIKEVYEVIFGKDTYKPAKGIYACEELRYFYNEKTGNYYEKDSNWGCGSGGPDTYGKKIISTNSKANKLEIVLIQYDYLTKEVAKDYEMEYTGKLYDYTNDKVISIKKDSDSWENEINNNINKFSHYKFTFNKEGNNYVLYSVEKTN